MQFIVSLATVVGLASAFGGFSGRLTEFDGDGTKTVLIDNDTGTRWAASGFPGFDTCISRCLTTFNEILEDPNGPQFSFQGFLSKDLSGCIQIDLRGNLGGSAYSCCNQPSEPGCLIHD